MADPTTVEAMTNTTPMSCVESRCNCDTMWSMAQQFCYVRLSDPIQGQNFRHKLVEDYAVRARRIAATYARFYLELETNAGSDPNKKGRFYWMALGAFASKTVACTLEAWQVRAQATLLSKATKDGLGMGNLWLFNDIAGWHFYYARHHSSFEICRDTRDTSKLVPVVKAQVNKLPWSSDALGKINNLKVSKYIKTGFDKVEEFENQPRKNLRADIQLKHLLAIADHEQRVILQPLIYDDPDFARWLEVQRWPGIKQMSPALELVFTSACSTEKPELKSVAPDGTQLENAESRMNWIGLAAKMFHGRMQRHTALMERELEAITGWLTLQDQ